MICPARDEAISNEAVSADAQEKPRRQCEDASKNSHDGNQDNMSWKPQK